MTRAPPPSRRMRSSASATLIRASSSGKSFRACSTIDELKSGILTASLTAYLYAMNDAFAPKNVCGFAEIIANIGLLADPIEVAADTSREIDLRSVARGANARRIAREMAHFAGTKFAVHFGRNVDVERIGNLFRDLANTNALAAADVDRQAIELVALRGEQVRARDVFDEGHVASLFAILIK